MKKEFIEKMQIFSNLTTSQTIKAYDAFIKVCVDELCNEDKIRTDIGTFKKVFRAAHTARNPQTGDPVNVGEKFVIRFKPSLMLKDIINK